MNGSLKLKWLQNFIKQYENFWFKLPSKFFSDFRGIEFLLKCDFKISKLPIKLSQFHQQVLHYWKLIFKHNFSPHNTPIFNNRCILIKRKSLYLKEWYNRGIWSILHLMDDRGNILDFTEFSNKYNLICSQKEYNDVVNAIPQALVNTIKGYLFYESTVPRLYPLFIQNCLFSDDKCSKNKFLRSLLSKECFPSP